MKADTELRSDVEVELSRDGLARMVRCAPDAGERVGDLVVAG